MKRPKYKEMYEWEKAAHYATEQELQRFQKMYVDLFWKLQGKSEGIFNASGVPKELLDGIPSSYNSAKFSREMLEKQGGQINE